MKKSANAFSLAEILIVIAIMGLLAVFTIPKFAVPDNKAKYNRLTQQAALAVLSAYETHKSKNLLNAGTSFDDLTPYLNYVSQMTTYNYYVPNGPMFGGSPTSVSCNNTAYFRCFKLHNGGFFWYRLQSFSGTANYNFIPFGIDPDGKTSGIGGQLFYLYYDGYIMPASKPRAGSWNSRGVPDTPYDAPWFSAN